MARTNKTKSKGLERVLNGTDDCHRHACTATSKPKLLENLAKHTDMAARCIEASARDLGYVIVQNERTGRWHMVRIERAAAA